MRLTYVGPLEAVEVPEIGAVVARGDSVEVDDAVGKRMALSADWQAASRPTKKEAD